MEDTIKSKKRSLLPIDPAIEDYLRESAAQIVEAAKKGEEYREPRFRFSLQGECPDCGSKK